jgi:hypothetical protein
MLSIEIFKNIRNPKIKKYTSFGRVVRAIVIFSWIDELNISVSCTSRPIIS